MDFNWDNMAGNLQDNAFGDKKNYDNETDSRFWKLSRDEKGDGAAIVRFLPDLNGTPFIALTKINAQNPGTKGFFVTEWSPASIGLKCPFNEKFTELWNGGFKDKAKTLGRAQRFITNVKIMKDPANPSNEGKIFLYDMSKTMIDMLKEVMVQTEQMKALDESPIAVYNPIEGNNFLIKVKDGENGIPTYTSSKFADKVTGIYPDKETATADIMANTYSLKEFFEPTNFKTYEELTDLRDRFLKEGKYSADAKTPENVAEGQAVNKAQTETTINTGLELGTQETPAKVETPAKADTSDAELDDLLADMDME